MDLAPISNLDSEHVKEMFSRLHNQVQVKIPGAKQMATQRKSYVKAKLANLTELQSKGGFRKHIKILKPFRKLLKNEMKRR